MSTGWHPPTADRETTYRDWYEWAWEATDQDRGLAIEVAKAALAASDRGADLARIIAAANSALSPAETAEAPPDQPGSTASPAVDGDQGWSIRDFGLLVSATVLALIAAIQIVSIAGIRGSHYSGSVSAAKTTAQHPNAAFDAAGAYKAATDDASAKATTDKAAATKAAR